MEILIQPYLHICLPSDGVVTSPIICMSDKTLTLTTHSHLEKMSLHSCMLDAQSPTLFINIFTNSLFHPSAAYKQILCAECR